MKPSRRRPDKLTPHILIASIATVVLLGLAFFAVDADSAPNWTLFLGRFHPALLHMPIGFLSVLAIIEYLDSSKGGPRIGKACQIVLTWTAWVSAIAAILGVLLALPGGYNEDLLARHRWLGCLTAVLAFWLIVLRTQARNQRRNGFSGPYHGALGATIILLLVVGHDGGTLTHGSGYLTKYLPTPLKSVFGMETDSAEEAGPSSFEAADVYQDIIHPIFEETCISCHGPDKSKGDLRLDTFELAMAGGDLGDTIIPGDIDASELIFRLHLDLDDDERMPPEGKPQPTDAQVALLEWWVESGAPANGALGELEFDSDIENALIAQLEGPSAADIAEVEEEAPLVVPAWEEIAEAVAELQANPRINIQPVAIDSSLLRVKAPFGENKFNDEALEALEAVGENIVELEIGGSDISDEGLSALSSMVNLERLYLQKTSVTDEGLYYLSDLKRLQYLNLYDTAVTDDGLEYLEDLKNLKSLYLWGSKVSAAGAQDFKDSMIDHSQIESWQAEIDSIKQKIKQADILIETGADAEGS